MAGTAPCAASSCRRGSGRAKSCPEPIFTPATKAESGHDENISFETMAAAVGSRSGRGAAPAQPRHLWAGQRHALSRGIILADTKFEWGKLPGGEIILIDEVLTPDSSRFWPVAGYQRRRHPPSFDKQFVRDWLESTTWDKNSPPPPLPEDVVARTRAKYLEAYEKLTGKVLPA